MFLFAIFGVDPAQNLTKYKRWLRVLIHEVLTYSSIVNEHNTKDVQGQGPSNIYLSLFVCFFAVYRPSQSFPYVNYDFSEKWDDVKY